MTDAIARQPAEWAPGERGGYQSMTMGFMLGELVRRVDGRPLERYFAEEIAGPLRRRLWLGPRRGADRAHRRHHRQPGAS